MALTWKQLAYQVDVSTADSKAVSAGVVASTADSKAVSAGTAASTADSKAVVADSKAVSAGTAASTADSKAVSAGLAASTADSKAVSAGTVASTASSVATSAGTVANSHAARHKLGGSDPILLNELGLPTSSIDHNGQQATNFVLHTVATSAAITGVTAVVGKVVFALDSLAPWVCTSAS